MADDGAIDWGDLFMQAMAGDPKAQEALAGLGVFGQNMGLANRQAQIGESLLGTPGAEGRTVGHAYVASSPLEHLGVAMEHMVGAKRMNDALAQQQSLIQGNKDARVGLFSKLSDRAEAMRRARASPQEVPPPVSAPQMVDDNLGG